MQSRLCLVSFGDRDEWYAEAHLSILTALGWILPPYEIVVATDRPERYRWLPAQRWAPMTSSTC